MQGSDRVRAELDINNNFGTNGCGHGFASAETLKLDSVAWSAVQAFAASCNFRHVDAGTGAVTFGNSRG